MNSPQGPILICDAAGSKQGITGAIRLGRGFRPYGGHGTMQILPVLANSAARRGKMTGGPPGSSKGVVNAKFSVARSLADPYDNPFARLFVWLAYAGIRPH